MGVVTSNGQDPTMTTNAFNEPKTLTVSETYNRNLLCILFGKPGFYPSQPELGMDIGKYLYAFEDDIDTSTIKAELAKQCADFLPDIQTGNFDVIVTRYEDKPLLLFKLPIMIDESSLSLILGITINKKGELIYRFKEDRTQLI